SPPAGAAAGGRLRCGRHSRLCHASERTILRARQQRRFGEAMIMDANQVPPRHHRGLLAGAVLLSAAAVTLPILQKDDQAAVPPVAAIASHQAAPAGTGAS